MCTVGGKKSGLNGPESIEGCYKAQKQHNGIRIGNKYFIHPSQEGHSGQQLCSDNRLKVIVHFFALVNLMPRKTSFEFVKDSNVVPEGCH